MRTNVKLLAMTALAASLAIVSCNKVGTPDEPGVPKSVTIKLSNVVPGTRSAGGSQISNGTPVTLNNFQVFFTDGNLLYVPKDVDNINDAETFFDGTSGSVPTEAKFHFLPAQVSDVVVIGNLTAEIEVEDGVTTLASLDQTLSIEDQQDIDNLTLYATAPLTLSGEAHTPDHDTPVYTADLELAPRIARLYIKDFSYTVKSDASVYKTLEMLKIAINNYYGEATLVDVTGADLQAQEINESTVWNWFSGFTGPGWFWDDLSGITLTATTANVPVTEDAGGLYYHFFVDKLASKVPQLVLQCNSNGEPQYLATLNFKDELGAPIEWKNGYIYEMSFAFTDEQLSHPDKCVDITVTPVEWQVETVIPEF